MRLKSSKLLKKLRLDTTTTNWKLKTLHELLITEELNKSNFRRYAHSKMNESSTPLLT